jgi:hypothetical protein
MQTTHDPERWSAIQHVSWQDNCDWSKIARTMAGLFSGQLQLTRQYHATHNDDMTKSKMGSTMYLRKGPGRSAPGLLGVSRTCELALSAARREEDRRLRDAYGTLKWAQPAVREAHYTGQR